ncbi:MlaC/ttg2D family ABC transporter substrate-binding protein [Hyalangium gracile]|uniref:MlaC/ttg2D family ABC transporter substrate-binding protein n=1 Tax=Hyalangium gracile TaxID=394092 RepID=UPI001CCCE010|nr:ABC transporter substrate-binding protein [Hyalangium gracile]
MIASLVAVTLLAAAPGPLEVVRSGYEDVQATARAPGATVDQLSAAVDKFVDFEELARRALGETWETITPAQRKAFTRAMRGMLRAFYAERTLGLGEAEVQYGQELLEEGEARVSTVVVVQGTRVPIDYRLYKSTRKAGGWRIYDIVTNQVSLLEDYRTQFRQLVATQGFNGLLSTLKKKQAQVERAAAARQAREDARAGKKQ